MTAGRVLLEARPTLGRVDGVAIARNQRLPATIQPGWEIPVVVVDLTEHEARQWFLSVNEGRRTRG
jgi:hypothetical protein